MIDSEKINSIINSSLGKLADFFAPQEKDRLAELVYAVLSELDNDVPYERWVSKAKQALTEVLGINKEVFGHLNLKDELDWDNILKQIYDSK